MKDGRQSEDHPGATVAMDRTSLLLVGCMIVLCCATPLITSLSRYPLVPPDAYPIFLRLFAFNDYAGSLAMLVMLTLTLAVPRTQQVVLRMAEWVGRNPAYAAGIAFVVLALCARFVYLAHPLSMDEYAPWMQAHAFAKGDLTAHYPPDLIDLLVPPGHQGSFIGVNHVTGEAVSKYWPGLALVMTPFVWLGATWCVNPAFGAIALLVVHRLVSDATSNRTAGGIAMLAAIASPQFTVNAISFYAMPGELALNLLFLWLLLKPGIKWAFAAGLAGGLSAIMHNPVPHGLMAIPCLLWLAWDRDRWPRLVAVLGGYLPCAALGLGWSALMSTVEAGSQAANGSAQQGILWSLLTFAGSVLTLPSGYLLLAKWYATWKIWIWTCPGLLLLLFLPRQRFTSERLLIAAFALTYLFYLFVHYDQGHGWGYRYIHASFAALPVVAGLWWAQASTKRRGIMAAAVAAGLLATPVFMWQTNSTVEHELSWRMEPSEPGSWVIFVAQDTGRYRGDLVQNIPGRTGIMRLVSRGTEKDAALMLEHFPAAVQVADDRRGSVWRLQ